jgi:alpha-1,3-rhamnosyl/mannosyltransferase
MEAMASGCAVLTANRYGTREIAEGAAVLVDPETVDDIAYGMNQLLNDQVLRESIKAAGLRRSPDFTWQRTAKQVLQVLESL